MTHVAWHPRSDHAVLAAGDKGGHVSLWQLDHESFEVCPPPTHTHTHTRTRAVQQVDVC